MKSLLVLTGFLCLAITQQSHAMSKKLKDFDYESLYDQQVVQTTQLRASDGSIVRFEEHSSANIKNISIDADKKGNVLYLQMNSGKKIPFKITGNTDYIKGNEDFTRLQILSLSSGQDHSIQFSMDDIERSEPRIDNRTESCTIHREETRCMRDEQTGERKCQSVDISISGYQEVETTSVTTSYATKMTVRNNKGQAVITGILRSADIHTSHREGLCRIAGY
ncbi:MAG: hypothetical protein J7501_02865 [Bdellovibrio sp.]|nr:hypothetical protein [Bdellovibrio sp.]